MGYHCYCDMIYCDVVSPYSHLTVHHTWKVKLSKQILHLVVFLAILLNISMVTRDVGAQYIPHQEGQAALLTFTVFLNNIIIRISSLCALGCTDSPSIICEASETKCKLTSFLCNDRRCN